MAAIDLAKSHFSTLKVRVIEVPEWAGEDGKPLLIYAHPMTLSDKQKISNYAERGGMEALVYTIILKARDAEGKPLFTIEHKHDLMNRADPNVLARISAEIVKAPSVEDLEKN